MFPASLLASMLALSGKEFPRNVEDQMGDLQESRACTGKALPSSENLDPQVWRAEVSKRTSVLGIGEGRDAGSPLLVHSAQKLLHIGGQ